MDKDLLPILGMLIGGGGLGVLTADESRILNPTAALGGALAGLVLGSYMKNSPFITAALGLNPTANLLRQAAGALPYTALGAGAGAGAGWIGRTIADSQSQKMMRNLSRLEIIDERGRPIKLEKIPLFADVSKLKPEAQELVKLREEKLLSTLKGKGAAVGTGAGIGAGLATLLYGLSLLLQ